MRIKLTSEEKKYTLDSVLILSTKCKTNLCVYCLKSHRSHELINLSELNYSKKNKNVLIDEMNNIERYRDYIQDSIINRLERLMGNDGVDDVNLWEKYGSKGLTPMNNS